MKPNIDDEIREFSYGALLCEIADRMLYSGRNTIAHKDVVTILQCVFGFEDGRSHRNKIGMCVAKGYLRQINKASYKMTDLGYERVRMAKGVPPEANTEVPVTDDTTEAVVYDADESGVASDVHGYLDALRRGGQ